MSRNESGVWNWEPVNVAVPYAGTTGTCVTLYPAPANTFLICGIGPYITFGLSYAPTEAIIAPVIGAPPFANTIFHSASISLGGTGFAMLATIGSGNYVVIGNATISGRDRYILSTWLAIPRSSGPCFSMARRYASGSDTLLIGCTASIVSVSLSTTAKQSSSPIVNPIGSGSYTSIAYSPIDDYIYIGSSFGIGFQLAGSTMKISRIFFAPESIRSPISSILIDSFAATPNIYWAMRNGAIWRTSASSFDALDTIDFSTTFFAGSQRKIAKLIESPARNGEMLVLASTPAEEGYSNRKDTASFISVLKTDCSGLDCKSCVRDSYCSYCYTSGSCVASQSCPLIETANVTTQCPYIDSTTPTRIAVTGGNYWTAYVNRLKRGFKTADYACVFTISNSTLSVSTTSNAVTLDGTKKTISCRTPAFPTYLFGENMMNYAGSAYIALRRSGSLIPWTPINRKANFYNCLPRVPNCAEANTACGWCFTTGVCTSANDTLCPTTDNKLKDPKAGFRPKALTRVTSVTPSLVSVSYTGNITLKVVQFPVFADPNKTFLCVSNSNRTSPATATVNPEFPNFYSSFTCPLPNLLKPTTIAPRRLAISIYTGSIRQIPLSSDIAVIRVYNCSMRTNCMDCLDPVLRNGCVWCPASRRCFDPTLVPGAACTQNNATCPVITQVGPPLAAITTFNSNALSVVVYGKGFTTASPLACTWTWPTIGSRSSTATIVNDTQAVCTSQGPITTPGIWNLGLNVTNGDSIVQSVPFNIYDCSNFSSCDSCVGYPGIQCEWCTIPGNSKCFDAGSSTGCNPQSLLTASTAGYCPRINSTDPKAIVLGHGTSTSLTINGENLNLDDTSNVETNFACGLTPYDVSGAPSGAENLYSARFGSSESVLCPSVSIPSGSYAMVRLVDTVTSMSAAAPVNISIVQCESFKNCTSCIEAGCMLCGGSCTGTCNTQELKQDVCPVFADVTPTYSDLSGEANIYIKASNLLPTYSSPDETAVPPTLARSWHHVDLELLQLRNLIKKELNTLSWSKSKTRISELLKRLESVEYEIQVGVTLSQSSFGTLSGPLGDSDLRRLEKLTFKRNSLALPTLPYTCSWDEDQVTTAQFVAPDTIICTSPTSGTARNVSLTVYLGESSYFEVPEPFELISCPSVASSGANAQCDPTCMAGQDPADQRCGWCALAGQCTSPALCPIPTDVWQPSCNIIALSQLGSNYEGGRSLIVNMSTPLPAYVDTRNVTCSFGTTGVFSPATIETYNNNTMAIQSISCVIPPSPGASNSKSIITVPVTVQYLSKAVTSSTAFSYVNCKAYTGCNECTTRPLCGWCSTTKKCTMDYECGSDSWTREKCPLNALAVGLGIGLGLLALLLIAALLAFLIIRARRRKIGLVIEMVEPNYDAIAWGSDVRLNYRLPRSQWSTLELSLRRNDFVLQLGLSFNCPATEQDSLAKGLVYVACAHGVATEMIKTIIRAEVQSCSLENQLFRSNSVASKMYKFYSRIVGVKYLYHCIARVVMELEVLGRRAIAAANGNSKIPNMSGSSGGSGSGTVSILDVSLELDATKEGAKDDDVDDEINRLQLQLICQKIISVLSKKTLRNIPKPLREIFVEIDQSVSNKFPGSNEAIYKGLGGLFFLRFVCPALTAPHVYGLLQAPPNESTQRQLILIAKVIQSIANMQTQTQKEEYMEKMGSFINKSIPRIQRFYDNLREAANIATTNSIYERPIVVPDEVRLNGLAATQAVLVHQSAKIKAWDTSAVLSQQQKADLNQIVDDCMAQDHHSPKKPRQV